MPTAARRISIHQAPSASNKTVVTRRAPVRKATVPRGSIFAHISSADRDLSVVNGQLRGAITFTDDEREFYVPLDDAQRERIGAHWQRPGRIATNPPELDCATYLRTCKRANSHEAVPNYGFDKPPAWGQPIALKAEDGLRNEMLSATLVAFTPRGEPAGHLHLHVEAQRDAEDRYVTLRLEPTIVFVKPRYRGRGYMADLTVGANWLIAALVTVVLNKIPTGWRYELVVFADYESVGGEIMSEAILDAAAVTADRYGERSRRYIIIERPELDAGY